MRTAMVRPMPMPDHRRLHSTSQLANVRIASGVAEAARKREVDLFQCTKARNPTRQNPTPKKRARRKNAARADPRHRSCPTLAINSEMRCPGVAKVAAKVKADDETGRASR